jgi:hypothetical protein
LLKTREEVQEINEHLYLLIFHTLVFPHIIFLPTLVHLLSAAACGMRATVPCPLVRKVSMQSYD